MKNIYSIGLIALLFLCSCSNGSSNNQSPKANKQKSINEVYSYADSSAKSTITVSGSRWSGKLVIITGFGSSYDNSNAIYSSGIVNEGKLYDDSGYIEFEEFNDTIVLEVIQELEENKILFTENEQEEDIIDKSAKFLRSNETGSIKMTSQRTSKTTGSCANICARPMRVALSSR